MIKRPKRGETEEDILRMQQEFLAERSKNPAMKPAAKIVKIEKAPKKSLFAQSREQTSVARMTVNAQVEPSIVLCGKTHDTMGDLTVNAQTKPSIVLCGKTHDKLADPVHSTNISGIVLGDIVEKQVEKPKATKFKQNSGPLIAFPIPEHTVVRANIKQRKSIFAMSMDKKGNPGKPTFQEDTFEKSNPSDVFGAMSVMIEDEKTAESVHEENLEVLGKMRQEDILEEQRELLDSIDPAVVALIAKRRQEKMLSAINDASKIKSMESEVLQDKNMSENLIDSACPMDTEESESVESIVSFPSNVVVDEMLQRSAAEKWVHFDVIEQDKLEWMRDIPKHATMLKPGEQFEARFDWKGVLLPYSIGFEKAGTSSPWEMNDRELYFHGEEPHRPGYTLQELFRLARSSVMQQRISAFGAIGGILNIYNQGFYDNILELPIGKIFFLLRFGFDENSPAILEVVSKALAYLFYNETDETLLDLVYDNPRCYWQPQLEVTDVGSDSEDSPGLENLQKQMQLMQINAARSAGPISLHVDGNEEESRTKMDDFQLAETDLIGCLLRTNILQHIYFILHKVRPDSSIVISCLKLLIRLARSGKSGATQIVNCRELIFCLLDNFLPGLEKADTNPATFYNCPQYLCLKLIRVLVSQNLTIAWKLVNLNIIDRLQNYLYTRDEIRNQIIKVQIETLRIIRCLLVLEVEDVFHKKFMPAFRYLLEWHVNHGIYKVGTPLLIRQHAAAILLAITSRPCTSDAVITLGDTLSNCCSSWFHEATKSGVKEFSQATLLSACLSAVKWYTRKIENMERLRNFSDNYLQKFLVSEGFVSLVASLQSSSIVLCTANDRRSVHPPLPNAGSVLVNALGPQLIVPQTYCVFLLSALWRLLEQQLSLFKERTLIDLLIQPRIVEPIVQYLKTLAGTTNRYVATNFFAKSELRLIYHFLCFDGFTSYLEKSQILQISYNFVCCLTAEYIPEIEYLFERVIFNSEYLDAELSVLKKWRATCLEMVYQHYIVVLPEELSLSVSCLKAPVLPIDWPYFQLKILLFYYIGRVHQMPIPKFAEREVIEMTLKFITLLEDRNPQLMIVTPTEKLMYLMATFMGPDSQFLELSVRTLLRNYLINFYRQCEDIVFDLDAVYTDKCKFENLYALFVDHFQAASYGDELFASLVLVPLAQKYDNKWRRRFWSEYAAALRFLDCREHFLIGGLQAYLEPAEDEESLLKCYAVALQTNLVRPNTLPFKIAQHHLAKFRGRTNY